MKTLYLKNVPECERIAIFGHHPGFTSVANAMVNLNFDNVPTCRIVGIHFNVKRWKDVKFGKGMLAFWCFPKEI